MALTSSRSQRAERISCAGLSLLGSIKHGRSCNRWPCFWSWRNLEQGQLLATISVEVLPALLDAATARRDVMIAEGKMLIVCGLFNSDALDDLTGTHGLLSGDGRFCE